MKINLCVVPKASYQAISPLFLSSVEATPLIIREIRSFLLVTGLRITEEFKLHYYRRKQFSGVTPFQANFELPMDFRPKHSHLQCTDPFFFLSHKYCLLIFQEQLKLTVS